MYNAAQNSDGRVKGEVVEEGASQAKWVREAEAEAEEMCVSI
jgi:hypothetical protein